MGFYPTLSHIRRIYRPTNPSSTRKRHNFPDLECSGLRCGKHGLSPHLVGPKPPKGDRPQDVGLRTCSQASAGGNKLGGAASTARPSAEWVGTVWMFVADCRQTEELGTSGPVSRILSRFPTRSGTVIHLAPRLLAGSSDLTRGLQADDPTLLFGLAPGGVYQASAITGGPVSSYLAFSTLPGGPA